MKGLVMRRVAMGLAGLVAAGCAALAPMLVRDPTQRFGARGFSVAAPPGSNWYVVMPSAREVHFTKRLGDAPVPSVYVAAWIASTKAPLARAEDLVPFKQRSLEEVRQQEPAYTIDLRDLQVDRTPGAECVRWVQEEEQTNHPNPALRSATLVTTTYGLDCLHPFDQRSMITIGYSERRIKGATSLIGPGQPLAAEGEAFVHSIRFTPP